MPPKISLGFAQPNIDGGGQRNRSLPAIILAIVYIVYSLEVGSFLIYLPWINIWENNYFLFRFPVLRPIMINPFLKGAVVGLGIINLWIGLYEVLHFRKGSGSFLPR